MTTQKGCNRFISNRRMAPPSTSEAGRRGASSGRRGQSSSSRNTLTWKSVQDSSTQGQLLEVVLDEIRKLNGTGSSMRSAGRTKTAPLGARGEDLLSRLIDLEHESEATTGTLSNVIASTEALLHPNPNGSNPKLGPRTLSALRAMATALSERLKCLGNTNIEVRRMLMERQEVEEALRMSESQRDSFLRQNAELQAMNKRFQKELMERDETIAQLEMNLHEARHMEADLSSMASLQRQLQQKEAECSQMSEQIHQLEADLAQTRIDANHICTHLRDSLSRAEETKAALKRVARVHKDRSSLMASEVEKLQHLLLDKEPLLERLVAEEEEKTTEREDFLEETTSRNCPIRSNNSTPAHTFNSLKEQSPPNPVTEEERRAYDGLVDLHKEECSRAEQRLRAMDIRLRTSEDRNRSMANQLSDTSSLLENVREELREAGRQRQRDETRLGEVEVQLMSVRKERDALQAKVEELVSDVRNSHRHGSPTSDSRARDRIVALESETDRLRAALDLQRQLRENAERQSADRLTKLREAEGNQKGLQRHLELLKDSYVKCFGDPRL